MDTERKTLGQIAFEAYRDQLSGVNRWKDVREPERQVWEATAAAVAEAAAEQSKEWLDDWSVNGRDGDGNLIVQFKPTGGRYRVLPEEDL